ncbi:adenylyl-sulfate kinase [Haloplanus natans]|uniref:adenylyl-sulfate kinase n=1 Tax=Haloplanus natans TaxID=376171 RepID=UPI0009FFE3BB|nr:adenylyl-sulfate kinase [Haloplanus natans]
MSFTIWFMGRPAAGKSTLAKRVENILREQGHHIENLDGDEIRKNLYPDLGFTREDRATNNRRTAFICKLLNRNDISVVTGMITPFRDAQQQAREIIESEGEFVLVYVKCSVEEAARRDPKNLYQQAQEGNIENFTGVNHPFQEPHNPDIVVDSEAQSVDESVAYVLHRLEELGVLETEYSSEYDFDLTVEEEDEIKGRLDDLGYLDD